jgi:mannose-1-phosphate guanylyltransferase
MKAGPRTHAVILAGGVGARFWPLSRRRRPKQFLPIAGPKSMIEETVERLRPVLPNSRILTISGAAQAKTIRRLVPGLPERNVLVEPAGRNTAASLILATAVIYLRDPGAVVFALPADHLIADDELFLKKLGAAAQAAFQGDVIVTFGIPPSYPSTGFGYIQFAGRGRRRVGGEDFYPVLRFKEKPGLEQAREFIEQGRHFWNSGMFIWRADVFAQKLETCAPDFYPFWLRTVRALKRRDRSELAAVFREIPATSIDYALMERADGVLMNKGNFGWSDVGSWVALAGIWPTGEGGHAVRGDAVFVDSRDCLVYSLNKLTAVVGLKDVIVVDTPDALLVCHKGADQSVKKVIDLLKKSRKNEYL